MTTEELIAYFSDLDNYNIKTFSDRKLMADYNEHHEEIEAELKKLKKYPGLMEAKRRALDRMSNLQSLSFKMKTAADLDAMDIPPIEWIVEGMLPVGLAMLGAPSKYYKSFMALGLCAAVCTGSKFLNHKTVKHSCLYYDLESTERRPRERLNQILGEDQSKPDNLFVLTGKDGVARIGEGFREQLSYILQQHKDIRLVIVDVFQMIRRPAARGQSAYDRDYEDLKELKQIADDFGICLMLIHHTRKMRDPSDIFNELSGSTGTLGALDSAWMISKDERFDEEATLNITGRDLESQQLRIQFDKKYFQWMYIGTPEEVAHKKLDEEYKASPIIKTIKKLVEQGGGEFTGSAQDISDASAYLGSPIYDDIRKIGRDIGRFEHLLYFDGISYEFTRQGHNRSKAYSFKRVNDMSALSALNHSSAMSAMSASS